MLGKATSPKQICGALGLSAVLLVSGCTSTGGRSTPTEEPWTGPWRSKSDTTSGVGLDSRAKEIERNLGIY